MNKTNIRRVVVGAIGTNCYLLQNKETSEIVIVDPGGDAGRIASAIRAMQGKPVAILLTHGHFDHILAADALRQEFGVKVYVHALDEELLENARLNLSAMWAAPFTMQADVQVKNGDVLTLLDLEIRIFHTPGHTQGGCCYYIEDEKTLFSGDTLFAGSYGRVDFPTSSPAKMQESVRMLLKTLPEDVDVYPGHDSTTSIGIEKRYNPLAEA